MRLFIVIILFGLGFSQAFADDFVRIRIKSHLPAVNLKGTSLHFQSKDFSLNPYQTVAIPKLSIAQIRLQSRNGKKHWRVQFPDEPQNNMNIYSSRLVIRGERVRIGLEPVPSKLFLYPNKQNGIDVVAKLDIETYLAGVLPSEMPLAWPLEALKAQAVVSRSYMKNIMNSRKAENYHMEASIHDQVYKAINLVGMNPKYRSKLDKALKLTQGQYLVNSKGQVYRSFYHADCGGQTEEPIHVWGIKQSNGTVKDPFCPQSPKGQWTFEIKRSQLKNLLADRLGIYSSSLKGLLVTQRTASGRIAQLAILYEGRLPKHLSAQDFREIVGYNKLKSTNFKFQWFGETLKVSGKGHGHGVGLCQWGARSAALSGYSYRKILSRYYPKTRLIREIPQKSPFLNDFLKPPTLIPVEQVKDSRKNSQSL